MKLITACLLAVAAAILAHYIARAPEGYQDSSGFRFGRDGK